MPQSHSRAGPFPTLSPARLPPLAGAAIVLAAVLAQSWILGLEFQMDDYPLLADPWGLFRAWHEADPAELGGVAPFMMRWIPWLLWGALAAVLPRPLGPEAFHAVALAAHAVVSLALAVVVTRAIGRRVDPERPWAAGFAAGLLFAAGSGGIQAVSWTCSWADWIVALLSIASLAAFLRARRSEKAVGWRAVAALAALGAILSKEPAGIAVPALALALLGLALGHLGGRLDRLRVWARVEVPLLLAVLVAGVLARRLYLGTWEPRYGAMTAPGLAECPGTLWMGIRSLREAIFPWNRDPLFTDAWPLLARAGLGPWIPLALALFPAAAWVLAPRARPAILGLAALTAVLAFPAGIIWTGSPTNVISRALYLPLTALTALQAVACTALLGTARGRIAGALGLALSLAAALDGTVHVARTEALASAEIARIQEAVESAWTAAGPASDAAPLAILLDVGEPGYGGIPLLGDVAGHAFAPPFADLAGLEVLTGTDLRQLEKRIPRAGLGGRGLAWIGPSVQPEELDVSGLEGAGLRAARSARLLAPLRPPATPRREQTFPVDAGAQRFDYSPPLPAHEVEALGLVLPPGPATSGIVLLVQRGVVRQIAVALPQSERPRRIAIGLWSDLAGRLGEPIEHVEWRSDTRLSEPPVALAALPELRLLVPAPGARVALDAADPPRLRLGLPGEWDLPPRMFAELRLRLSTDQVDLVAELSAEIAGARPGAELDARIVMLSAAAGQPGLEELGTPLPWKNWVDGLLLPGMRERGGDRIEAELRVLLTHADGTRAASSEWVPATLAPP